MFQPSMIVSGVKRLGVTFKLVGWCTLWVANAFDFLQTALHATAGVILGGVVIVLPCGLKLFEPKQLILCKHGRHRRHV